MIGQNYESIIKAFTKTVDKLKAREAKLKNDIAVRDVQITTLEKANIEAKDEAIMCMGAASKIEQLFK
jgi:hypothetical protein